LEIREGRDKEAFAVCVATLRVEKSPLLNMFDVQCNAMQ
jgi:hypothetical protein